LGGASRKACFSDLYSYYVSSGLEIETKVKRILEVSLWRIDSGFRVYGPFKGPYDLEIRLNDKVAYVEVKSSFFPDRLEENVKRAFKRDHPEPFFVIGVLKLQGRIYLYPDMNTRMKFDDKNLRKLITKIFFV